VNEHRLNALIIISIIIL